MSVCRVCLQGQSQAGCLGLAPIFHRSQCIQQLRAMLFRKNKVCPRGNEVCPRGKVCPRGILEAKQSSRASPRAHYVCRRSLDMQYWMYYLIIALNSFDTRRLRIVEDVFVKLVFATGDD